MRLTKRAVEALENKDIHYEVRDDAQKGFVVRVGETGNKAFYRVYRTGKGRRAPLKRLHIGSFPRMSIEQARNIAKEKAALVVMGDDPARMVQDEKSTPFVKDIIVFLMIMTQKSKQVQFAHIVIWQRHLLFHQSEK